MIFYVAPRSAAWTVHEYLSRWGKEVAGRLAVVHYEDFLERRSFERGTWVLSALCSLTDETRARLASVHGRLAGREGLRFLNHPTRTLRRYGLLEELWRRGWNEFRAVRATEDFAGLRYPVFLRSERHHDGALSPVLESPRAVEAAIGRALVRGRPLHDLLVVELCDTSDAEGCYRKYTAYIVGDRVLSRNVEKGHDWVVKHSSTEFTRALVEEERQYGLDNPHKKDLERIFAIAGAQYGRIDYAVKDGRIQTWEINLHPTIGRGPGERKRQIVPPELEGHREVAKSNFHKAFREAWEAVDDVPPGPAVEIETATSASRASAPEPVLPPPSRLARMRRLALRPVRRAALLLATPFLPGIGRTALRRARARSG